MAVREARLAGVHGQGECLPLAIAFDQESASLGPVLRVLPMRADVAPSRYLRLSMFAWYRCDIAVRARG